MAVPEGNGFDSVMGSIWRFLRKHETVAVLAASLPFFASLLVGQFEMPKGARQARPQGSRGEARAAGARAPRSGERARRASRCLARRIKWTSRRPGCSGAIARLTELLRQRMELGELAAAVARDACERWSADSCSVMLLDNARLGADWMYASHGLPSDEVPRHPLSRGRRHRRRLRWRRSAPCTSTTCSEDARFAARAQPLDYPLDPGGAGGGARARPSAR